MPSEIEQLYREHRAGLVRLVERELHDHHDAEDVVQTAFLDAQRALDRGTVPRNPRAWLATIALNAAHRLRRRRLNADPLEEYAVHEASRMPEIRAALASLPTAQRAAVLYRDVLGLSYGETAEQMGTSVNAVTMLLHRGRQRLRKTLAALTDGVGVWRWLQQGGASQVAVIKGAAAVVVAAGLTTAGVATARAVAPIESHPRAATPSTRAGSATAEAAHSSRGTAALGAVPRHSATTHDSAVTTRPASTQDSPAAGGSSPAAASLSAAGSASSASEPTATSSSGLTLPTLPVSSVAAAVPAAVTVSTPVATVTVATPQATTATIATPITTVTLPIP